MLINNLCGLDVPLNDWLMWLDGARVEVLVLLGDYEKVSIFKFIGKVINESIRAGG